jgi:hypothetical protein
MHLNAHANLFPDKKIKKSTMIKIQHGNCSSQYQIGQSYLFPILLSLIFVLLSLFYSPLTAYPALIKRFIEYGNKRYEYIL